MKKLTYTLFILLFSCSLFAQFKEGDAALGLVFSGEFSIENRLREDIRSQISFQSSGQLRPSISRFIAKNTELGFGVEVAQNSFRSKSVLRLDEKQSSLAISRNQSLSAVLFARKYWFFGKKTGIFGEGNLSYSVLRQVRVNKREDSSIRSKEKLTIGTDPIASLAFRPGVIHFLGERTAVLLTFGAGSVTARPVRDNDGKVKLENRRVNADIGLSSLRVGVVRRI